ncbi:hypothetical protein BU16DRAFT_567413 [Lophium mytilinum]|uniref:Uncharacterized protein n=1 Tax=Lophium mytilinum TaxID=390894 RepID=A0A6A6QAG3_9PEZI|nr:hypothetical protein BU16DRAFT_567413 [Lophium mytilinum]
MAVPSCPSFAGNPDLYGLGIRLGVYLQWVSTWLSISIDPDSAQETHDANSIFVFAIIIAVIQAAHQKSIKPVEAHLMLQICFGFYFTVLSILGIRLQLLGPGRLERLNKSLRKLLSTMTKKNPKPDPGLDATATADGPATLPFVIPYVNIYVRLICDRLMHFKPIAPADILQLLREAAEPIPTRVSRIPIGNLSSLKHHSLSWSGVLWRSSIAALLVASDLWLWYTGIQTLPTESDGAKCISSVFMFSRQPLRHAMLTLYRVTAIAGAAIVFLLLLYVFLISIRLFLFFILCVYRQIVFDSFQFLRPGFLDRLQQRHESIRAVLETLGHLRKVIHTTAFSSSLVSVRKFLRLDDWVPFLNVDFWWVPYDQIPRLPDLLRVMALLSTGGASSGLLNKITESSHGYRLPYQLLSIAWHFGWWERQFGAGQLIPFIIGVASSARAVQRICLVLIKKKYPDWASVELVVRVGEDPIDIDFEIVKREPGEEEASNSTGPPTSMMQGVPMQDFSTGRWG